jgi:hypothetical protein
MSRVLRWARTRARCPKRHNRAGRLRRGCDFAVVREIGGSGAIGGKNRESLLRTNVNQRNIQSTVLTRGNHEPCMKKTMSFAAEDVVSALIT